ncbi:hypothetical protein GCM10022217_14190 [Chryseobacterium ginsenosidimutans]
MPYIKKLLQEEAIVFFVLKASWKNLVFNETNVAIPMISVKIKKGEPAKFRGEIIIDPAIF